MFIYVVLFIYLYIKYFCMIQCSYRSNISLFFFSFTFIYNARFQEPLRASHELVVPAVYSRGIKSTKKCNPQGLKIQQDFKRFITRSPKNIGPSRQVCWYFWYFHPRYSFHYKICRFHFFEWEALNWGGILEFEAFWAHYRILKSS